MATILATEGLALVVVAAVSCTSWTDSCTVLESTVVVVGVELLLGDDDVEVVGVETCWVVVLDGVS
mgnify:CR=1 FL=1